MTTDTTLSAMTTERLRAEVAALRKEPPHA